MTPVPVYSLIVNSWNKVTYQWVPNVIKVLSVAMDAFKMYGQKSVSRGGPNTHMYNIVW